MTGRLAEKRREAVRQCEVEQTVAADWQRPDGRVGDLTEELNGCNVCSTPLVPLSEKAGQAALSKLLLR
eukprot:2302739-Alexandrium_andersonii.AAC.1